MFRLIEIYLKDNEPLIIEAIEKYSDKKISSSQQKKKKFLNEIIFEIKKLILESRYNDQKLSNADFDKIKRNLNFHIQNLIFIFENIDSNIKFHKSLVNEDIFIDKLSIELKKLNEKFDVELIQKGKKKGRNKITDNDAILNFILSLAEIYKEISGKSPAVFSEKRKYIGKEGKESIGTSGAFYDFFEICYPRIILKDFIKNYNISSATIRRVLKTPGVENSRDNMTKNKVNHLTRLKKEHYFSNYPEVESIFLMNTIRKINENRENIFRKERVWDNKYSNDDEYKIASLILEVFSKKMSLKDLQELVNWLKNIKIKGPK